MPDEILNRFVEKVRIGNADDCWIWTGSRKSTGYGTFNVSGKTHSAHRIAYRLCNGDIRDGQIVRHSCDNPSCCNPNHLLSGTQSDNMRDMSERMRTCGQLLSDVDALEIRRLYLEEGVKQADISRRYGVTKSTVSAVIRGKNFFRLGAPDENSLRAARSRAKASVTGEKCSQSKMTADIVRAMRDEYAAGGVTYKQLAEKYGMSTMPVCNAIRRKSWKDVE